MFGITKRYGHTLLCILCLAALLGTSCSKRKQLSDKQLAQVFHDAFLTNAYIFNSHLNVDSLRLYEPIFQKYGYTTADVQYTIGSFSTRKSARLGDVVERAIAMLEAEGVELDRQVTILDTVDNIAQRRATSIILEKELILMRDTSDIIFTINDVEPGRYAVQFDYRIDSISNAENYKFLSWLETENGYDTLTELPTYRRINLNQSQLTENIIGQMNRSVLVNQYRPQMVVQLAYPTFNKKNKADTAAVTIKNFTIRRMPSIENSRGMVFEELVPMQIFNSRFYDDAAPTDSL